jgi:4-hydroxybenzoate polyprenyltransferase
MMRDWPRTVRPHHVIKNALVFVPVLASHRWSEPGMLTASSVAFALFCAVAIAGYLVNDVADRASDRQHSRKAQRPVAAGRVSVASALAVATILLVGALLVCWFSLRPTLPYLAMYGVASIAYTLWLKRVAIVDVLLLAGFHVLRIIAGGAATTIFPSFWLLAFAALLFLSLGTAKRYAELQVESTDGVVPGRAYTRNDLPLLLACGCATAYASVLVFALYVNSGAPGLYAKPRLLWLMAPVLLYWMQRLWLKTTRGEMHGDPVVYALCDLGSLGAATLCALLFVLAL